MIEPTWESECGSVKLWRGDCLEVMASWPDGAVDAVVSSPPYNMIAACKPSGLLAEHRHKKSESYATYQDNKPQEEYEQWMRDVFGTAIEKCRGTVWVNHKTRFINKLARHPIRYLPWEIHQEVIWARPGSTTLNANRYAPSHELIIGFGLPATWNRCNDTRLTVWNINPETSIDGHPCPFPVDIPIRLLQSSTETGHAAADPFMGSGTTGVAAVRLGRKFWGVEIDKNYFDIAKRRILEELASVAFHKGENSSSIRKELEEMNDNSGLPDFS